jgi:hypothetical protein
MMVIHLENSMNIFLGKFAMAVGQQGGEFFHQIYVT